MLIEWLLETGVAGEVRTGIIEVDDNATDDEIEQEAREAAFNEIDWSWRKVNEEGEE